MKFPSLLFRGALAFAIAFPLAAAAADTVLVEAGEAKVTTVDVRADALRIPPEIRAVTLTKPQSILQLSNNLVVRRALAAEAEAAGIANEPTTQSALQIARDRVLSDLLFARMDEANKPTRQVVESMALLNYKANPKRFDLPEEFGASHILVRVETPDAKAKAQAILAELKAGADFAKVAREKSEDTNAKEGGDLGFFPPGQMVPPFDAAVQKMQKPGELSDVVETQFGYHIIRFNGRRASGVRTFEQVREPLMREAEAKILQDKRLAHVQEIQRAVKFDQAAIEAFANSNTTTR
jgi:peptidyl-prolyl cis-trans isomerase C